MKKHIPNIITLFNMFFGSSAVVAVLYGYFTEAFLFFIAAGIADYADGFVARILNVSSAVGKQLDSMGDMVSFGFFPGAIYYVLLAHHFGEDGFHPGVLVFAALPAFCVTVFSGLRLAKFNIDTRQTENFIGLPTPAATLFTVGLLTIYYKNSFGLQRAVTSPYFLLPVIVILSYLLVSEIPFFSLKFKKFTWKGNEERFSIILLTFILLFVLKEPAFFVVIALYIFFNLMKYLLSVLR